MEQQGSVTGWRTPSRCEGGACIEVAAADPRLSTTVTAGVLVRDTQDRGGHWLTVTPDDWRAFTAAVKAG